MDIESDDLQLIKSQANYLYVRRSVFHWLERGKHCTWNSIAKWNTHDRTRALNTYRLGCSVGDIRRWKCVANERTNIHLLDACRHRKSTFKYHSAISVPIWIIQFLRNNLPISRTCNARRWTPRDRGRLIACANDGIVSDCCKLRILFAHKLHQVAVCIAGHTLSVSISSDHIALYALQLMLDETSKLIYQNI